jgi:hypothetical protein
VRVTSVREAAGSRLIVGCSFIEIDALNQARVARLAASAPSPTRSAAAFDMSALRLLAADEQPDEGGWRRRFKR